MTEKEANLTFLLGIIRFNETGEEVEAVGEYTSFKEAATAGNRLIQQLEAKQGIQGITIRSKGKLC
jgi:hypothetical protein